MARKPRVFGTSGFYHVILRGNNQQNLFVDNEDRFFFINRIKKYSKELEIVVHCYCLMSNHVHILVGNAGENLSLLVQKIANSYVYYFNHKYDRCGHLFQGRFKSEPILDDVYFKTVYRYILQNSEKAGLGRIDQYKWNSYWALKRNKNNSFVDTNYIYGIFKSQQQLFQFIFQKETRQCMEFENKLFFSDIKAIKLIKKIFNISSPYELERLNIDDQVKKCGIMRKHGLSINQISRLTGISKLIIRKS
ncbi:transposase [Treponema sp.]|uniref:transposase n=1 Tax=Treponema sp. TaxID=166 RepID=UPI00388DEFFF